MTRLSRCIETNSMLRHKLLEYMKIAELEVVIVLGSVEDERIFSTLSFMKNKLHSYLSTHLPLWWGCMLNNSMGLLISPMMLLTRSDTCPIERKTKFTSYGLGCRFTNLQLTEC